MKSPLTRLFSPLQSELQSDPKVINDIIALALHDALTYDKVGLDLRMRFVHLPRERPYGPPFRECTKCA
jgi:hypothetical protein